MVILNDLSVVVEDQAMHWAYKDKVYDSNSDIVISLLHFSSVNLELIARVNIPLDTE